MRVFVNLDGVKVEIPNFDIHNAVLPSVGDHWTSPSRESIDYRIERGYMKVTCKKVVGDDGRLKEVGIPPDTEFRVTARRFGKMDFREVVICMELCK